MQVIFRMIITNEKMRIRREDRNKQIKFIVQVTRSVVERDRQRLECIPGSQGSSGTVCLVRGNLGLIPRHTYKPQLSAAGNVTSIAAVPSRLITTLRLAVVCYYPLNIFSTRNCENETFYEIQSFSISKSFSI